MSTNKDFYSKQIEIHNESIEKAKSKFRTFSVLRLSIFVLALTFSIYFGLSWNTFIILSIATILFLGAVAASVKSKYARDISTIKKEINLLELKVLDGNWSFYEDGSEFKNNHHAYITDLDVFGKGSIFQLLNRTTSQTSKNLLADSLAYGSRNISLNNAGIEEHTKHMEWNHLFIAEGLYEAKEAKDDIPLDQLKKIDFKNPLKIKILCFAIPITSIISTILLIFDVINVVAFSSIIILILGIIGNEIRKSNKIIFGVLNFERRINAIRKQLTLYKSLKIQDESIKKFQASLFTDEQNIISEINDLNTILNRMNFRMNFLVGLILNFFLAWDFNIRMQIEKWMDQNNNKLSEWEEKLALIELWISGASFKYNFPDAKFAEFNSDDHIIVENFKHPFIAHQKIVANSLEFDQDVQFQIITGPNMAGKSTFLRSFGLVFVFANAGFPILASRVNIPHMKLYTSMRTSDNLQIESSYFHAELTRLRFIVDEIEKGEKIFVILDEILKGTNSKDKEIGSAKFLKKLKKLKTYGLIATHDLSLCELSKEDPAFHNIYFDSIITADSISFDYICRKGICKNMNASFLLKQMKLTDEDDD